MKIANIDHTQIAILGGKELVLLVLNKVHIIPEPY